MAPEGSGPPELGVAEACRRHLDRPPELGGRGKVNARRNGAARLRGATNRPWRGACARPQRYPRGSALTRAFSGAQQRGRQHVVHPGVGPLARQLVAAGTGGEDGRGGVGVVAGAPAQTGVVVDREATRLVVTGDDEEGLRVGRDEAAGSADGFVEAAHRGEHALPVVRVRRLVDPLLLDEEEEPVGAARQPVQGRRRERSQRAAPRPAGSTSRRRRRARAPWARARRRAPQRRCPRSRSPPPGRRRAGPLSSRPSAAAEHDVRAAAVDVLAGDLRAALAVLDAREERGRRRVGHRGGRDQAGGLARGLRCATERGQGAPTRVNTDGAVGGAGAGRPRRGRRGRVGHLLVGIVRRPGADPAAHLELVDLQSGGARDLRPGRLGPHPVAVDEDHVVGCGAPRCPRATARSWASRSR